MDTRLEKISYLTEEIKELELVQEALENPAVDAMIFFERRVPMEELFGQKDILESLQRTPQKFHFKRRYRTAIIKEIKKEIKERTERLSALVSENIPKTSVNASDSGRVDI